MASGLAKRAAGDARSEEASDATSEDTKRFIRTVYPLALQRDPSETEIKAASDVIDRHGAHAFCRALLNLNELIYID